MIKDSIAVITSHRGGVDLPAPWRAGREAKDGSPTAYITARDLGIDLGSIQHAPRRASVPAAVIEPVDEACITGVRAAWNAKAFPRDDHPQFVKGGSWVHSCGLREFPLGHRHAGDLIAPLFRPTTPGSLSIELCGAQQLLRDTSKTPDKYIVAGSRPAGAFVPLPLRQNFFTNSKAGAALGEDWLPPSARIVVTEGVRTGQAVRTATAGWSVPCGHGKDTVVLAALAANNLPAVARWLKSSGLAAKHEVVFATDNDLAKSNFIGIRKAIEAAELCGGRVAVADNQKAGFDAHDLLKERKHDLRAGMAAVREFIDSARAPEQVRADRAEAFEVRQQNQSRGKESGRQDAGLER
ncbi:MAG: hypothetical protein HKL99_14445 [Burkholderiales bacterium]|nr:hypothetical protein [Burkholderiales bacterium]